MLVRPIWRGDLRRNPRTHRTLTHTSPLKKNFNTSPLTDCFVCFQPMLGQIKRSANEENNGDCYRVRSFSITPSGICNLGDSFKSRRSTSISSVSSSCSNSSGAPPSRDRIPRSVPKVNGKKIGSWNLIVSCKPSPTATNAVDTCWILFICDQILRVDVWG